MIHYMLLLAMNVDKLGSVSEEMIVIHSESRLSSAYVETMIPRSVDRQVKRISCKMILKNFDRNPMPVFDAIWLHTTVYLESSSQQLKMLKTDLSIEMPIPERYYVELSPGRLIFGEIDLMQALDLGDLEDGTYDFKLVYSDVGVSTITGNGLRKTSNIGRVELPIRMIVDTDKIYFTEVAQKQ
jgi:hypothetical protein